MARNLGEMVVFRILQGAGGGGILPISQAIMMESFPKENAEWQCLYLEWELFLHRLLVLY